MRNHLEINDQIQNHIGHTLSIVVGTDLIYSSTWKQKTKIGPEPGNHNF